MRGKIIFAPDDKIASLQRTVDQVLLALAEIMGEDGIIKALVTDRSLPSDFGKVDYQALGDRLGIRVELGEYIWQIAERLEVKP